MIRSAPQRLSASATLIIVLALTSTEASAAEASQGLVGCIDDLPHGIELDLTLKGHVNTGAEGPRFRGELEIDDGSDDAAPPPAYVESLVACMKTIVHGEKSAPRERTPNSVLIF